MEQDFIQFCREFLQAEYDTVYAMMTEPNKTIFQSKISKYQAFFDFEIGTNEAGLYRPDNVDDNWFAEQKDHSNDIAPRQLFVVRTYQHPEYGLIHRCYVSDGYIGNDDYSAVFYIGKLDYRFKVISRYLKNHKHSGLDFTGGKKIKNIGTCIDVLRFMPPSHALDLIDYESDFGTI